MARKGLFARSEEAAALVIALSGLGLALTGQLGRWIERLLAPSPEQRRADTLRSEEFRGGPQWFQQHIAGMSSDEYANYERDGEWVQMAFLAATMFVVPTGILFDRLELMAVPGVVLLASMLSQWIDARRRQSR